MVDYTKSSIKNPEEVQEKKPASDVKPAAHATLKEKPPETRVSKIKDFTVNMLKDIYTTTVVPTIKKMVYDATITAVGSALHMPNAARMAANGWQASKVSYNSMYSGGVQAQSPQPSLDFGLERVQFASNLQADDVLQRLDEVMSMRGRVTVADFYAASGIQCDYTYGYYGWLGSLQNARPVMLDAEHWIIKLPKPIRLQ